MATPLTDGINALTAYANEVTGASDTTLSDAVESLVAGYGSASPIKYLTSVTATTSGVKNQECGQHLLELISSVFPTESKYLMLLYRGMLSNKVNIATNQCTMFYCKIENGESAYDAVFRRYATSDANYFAAAGSSTGGNNNTTINVGDIYDVFELMA